MTALPISVRGLTREFGQVLAVDDVTFDVAPGRVTGLLGRNGAGKTTTLRVILGLAHATRGSATVFGRPYERLPGAPHRVGVMMGDVGAVPGATVIGDLRTCARALGLPRRRCEEVLEIVDLDAPTRKVTQLSTGMRQRHGLAVALLADPELLVLDEPANGLDPDGIRWLRDTLRALAARGNTVLLSSHHLAEIEQTVDDVVVVQRSLRYAGSLDELTAGGQHRLEDRFFDLVGAPTSQARDAESKAVTNGGRA